MVHFTSWIAGHSVINLRRFMKAILYPGSFDPITLGHLDVISRLRQHFERVVVLVADSPHKKYFFSQTERKDMILAALDERRSMDGGTSDNLGRIEIKSSEKLTVEFAKSLDVQLIARSVRTVADWEYEYAMADANKKLAPGIETFFIMASPEHGFVSSSLVREVAQFGGDTKKFVPNCVAEALTKKVKNMKGPK